MSTQRYSVTPHPIETLLTWVRWQIPECDDILAKRRKLIALKIKTSLEAL